MSMSRVARGYDRLSKVYDAMARIVYGNALRRAQTTFLPEIQPNTKVLVVGGGSGWLLEALLRQNDSSKITYLELSGGMLAQARARIASNFPTALPRVNFVLGSATEWEGKQDYDWLITHCLLDMFEGQVLVQLVGKLGKSLNAQGRWYFSDFRHAPRGMMRVISSALIWLMYRFFRIVCGIGANALPDFDAAFEVNAWQNQDQRLFFGGMIRADILTRPATANK